MHCRGLLMNMVRNHAVRARALDQNIKGRSGVGARHGSKKENYRPVEKRRGQCRKVAGPEWRLISIKSRKPSPHLMKPASFFSLWQRLSELFERASGQKKGRHMAALLKWNLKDSDQRLENWKRLRAPGRPGFLRSFMRGSRVRRPSCLSGRRRASSTSRRARLSARRRAPA